VKACGEPAESICVNLWLNFGCDFAAISFLLFSWPFLLFLILSRRRNYICPIIGIIAIEIAISELCRREGLAVSLYYKWSKAFLDAGKNGLTRATLRDATSEEVTHLKTENNDLKKAVAELTLDVIRYKKSLGM
jgi:hypothetical protein